MSRGQRLREARQQRRVGGRSDGVRYGEKLVIDDAALVELDLPPRPDAIVIARLVVAALARDEAGFDEERTADVRLAVSEATTNAVEAQIERGERAPIRIRCWSRPDEMRVDVRDRGGGLRESDLVRSADLRSAGRLAIEGGLGVPLIRLLADEAEFRPVEGGTEVVMSFGPDYVTGRIVP